MALGPVSFAGITSGFDVKSIIAAIMGAERRPLTRLQAKQTGIDSRKGAYNDLSAKLGSLRTVLQDLASSGTLAARTATSSDTSVLTASGTTSADLGTHEVEVLTLARAHRVRSITVPSRLDPSVSDGTITIQSGARAPINLSISAAAGNNSLVGVRDAINAANGGVTASIVNDGSGDLLVVRATNAGTASSLTIADTTSLGLDDPGHELDAAADATARVDGVLITSATNSLSTAISGVTLNLVSAKPGTVIDVTLAADTAKVKEAVKKFVDAYNDVAGFLKGQFAADPKTGKAGVLAGEALLRRVQDIVSSRVSSGIAGIPSTDLTTLGAIGVSIEGSSGRLTIDDAKLTAALTDRFDQIGRLFASAGRASDALVSFAALTSATQEGTYAVQVTTAPEKAVVDGYQAISGGGISADEALTITVGAASATVNLAQNDTIDEIVTKLNAGLSGAGLGVRASNQSGALRLTSTEFGSGVSFSVVSDLADPQDGTTTGIGTAPLSDSGVDIAGTIGGAAAAGAGSVLTGASGGDYEGLQVSVVTDAATIAAKGGDFGTITVTRGVADMLARELKSIVDPTGGLIANTIIGFTDETRRITDQIARLEERLTLREVVLTAQFNAAEQAIAALQQQQSSLNRTV